MGKLFKKLVFIMVVCTCFAAGPYHCFAQYRSQSATDTVLSVLQKDTLNTRQPDSIKIAKNNITPSHNDSITVKKLPWQPIPKKAGLYSALLPGLGQLYNRQYWKIPLVYAGLGTATYFFVQNLNSYQSYRRAYLGRTNNPYPTDEYVKSYSTDQLQQLQNDYSKYLNMTVLFGSLGYALQVLDAITSAHLRNFDISRDISMRMRPVAMPQGIGMGIVFNVKNPKPLKWLPHKL